MTGTEIATTQVDAAKMLASSDMLPPHLRGKPANLLWTMQLADGLDLTLAQAVNGVQVINGTPSLKAETMRALVLRAGHRFRVDVQTDTECTVTVARKEWPDDLQTFTYTMADAATAGLSGSANYKKHPKSMLLARVTSNACRAVFPDVIQGFYVPEEVAEFGHTAQPVTPPPVPKAKRAKSTATRQPAPVDETPPHVDIDTGEILDAEVVDVLAVDVDAVATEIATADLEALRDLWSTWHTSDAWPDIEPLIADRRAQLEAAQ